MSIEFTNENVDGTNPDNNRHLNVDQPTNQLQVDLSGRGFYGGRFTANFTAAPFASYVLGNINPATDPNNSDGYARTITLPEGNPGDRIEIRNDSRFAFNDGNNQIILLPDGSPSTIDSSNWRIIPSAGEKINYLPPNTDVVLDEEEVAFSLIYGNDNSGWLIIV